MLSIRLTPEERNLVEAAAAQKGWKAATFLRNASLERAANVLNLSRATSFDFSGLAREVAVRLVMPRQVEFALLFSTNGEVVGALKEGEELGSACEEWGVKPDELAVAALTPEPLTSNGVGSLEEALQLGGVEFAAAVIVECHRLSNRPTDEKLPPPIDPRNLKPL